jgi:predicted permease
MLESFLQDVRYALRWLRRSPLFAVTAVLSLAIGIGANTAIFSVASALLLRPLPGLTAPDRLVDIGRSQDGQGFDNSSYPNYRDLRARMTTVEGVYATRLEPQPMSLSGTGQAERIYGTIVTANYFEILGSRPHLGRLLRDDDDRVRGGSPVVVISHELWARRFASDPAVVGRAITLNGHAFTIVGVASEGFRGTTLLKPDAWVPMSMLLEASPRHSADVFTGRGSVWLLMGGRLKPGVTTAQANAEAAAIGAALERDYPRENRGKSFVVIPSAVVPGHIQIVGGFVSLLMAIVGLVLLIACSNVSGMLLARAAGRQREIAVRLAIGAGRGRLIRQLLTETALIFVAAGVAGLILTKWLTSLLLALLPRLPMPVSLDVVPDWRVISFAIATSIAAAMLTGLAPALQASRGDLTGALKAEGLGIGPSRLRLRNAFVVGQVSMSVVMIVAAALFTRALQHAASIEPGFDDRNVEVISLDLSLAGYTEATGEPFVKQLLSRTRTIPGVVAASTAVDLPLDGGRFGLGDIRVPGLELPTGGNSIVADWNVVEPGYFDTNRLPLVLGRDFDERDGRSGPRVVIVNEAFARRAWPGQDPIGRQIEYRGDNGPVLLTVAGVTSNAKLVSLNDETGPFVYVPLAQQYMNRVELLARTSDGRSIVPQIRALLQQMNPNLPVTEATTLSLIISLSLIPQRIAAAVAGSLGLVGLLLAAIGIYGVTSYAVSRRTREIGIRIALGADHGRVIRLVLRQGLALAASGVAIGVAIAAVGSKFLESLLFGVRGLDPITFGGACLLFGVVTLVASYVPARRAAGVDPIVALRNE